MYSTFGRSVAAVMRHRALCFCPPAPRPPSPSPPRLPPRPLPAAASATPPLSRPPPRPPPVPPAQPRPPMPPLWPPPPTAALGATPARPSRPRHRRRHHRFRKKVMAARSSSVSFFLVTQLNRCLLAFATHPPEIFLQRRVGHKCCKRRDAFVNPIVCSGAALPRTSAGLPVTSRRPAVGRGGRCAPPAVRSGGGVCREQVAQTGDEASPRPPPRPCAASCRHPPGRPPMSTP